jgi:hypothetical protein
VIRDPDGAVVQLRVRGCWNQRLFLAVRTAVLKTLVEHPAAVILDLRAVQDTTASSAPLWFRLHRTRADPASAGADGGLRAPAQPR